MWSDRGVTVILRGGEKIEADRAVIAVPLGLLRAGLPTLDPLPPEEQQKAIGRIGYGAGILGKIYLRFPHRFWPEQPKWFGRLPDSPDRRGTFNTWVSHVGETGLPILLSFSNGATAARLDRSASDEEVKEVAMSSLRKMFGNDIPEPEGMLYPRWLSDPVVAGRLFLSRPRQHAGRPRGLCPAARQPRLLRRRGDRAGRVRHGTCRPVVGRADRRGAVPGGDRPAGLPRHAALGQGPTWRRPS